MQGEGMLDADADSSVIGVAFFPARRGLPRGVCGEGAFGRTTVAVVCSGSGIRSATVTKGHAMSEQPAPYDMYTAATFDEAGIPVLLIGDSASNDVFGNKTSLPVTVDQLLPLVRAVSGAARQALAIADLPFGSYEASAEQCFHTAVRFMKEAGAHAVKPEGGEEMVPEHVGAEITRSVAVPTVGIGARNGCDAQVLVWQDMAGPRTGQLPRFVKRYADVHGVLREAAQNLAADVAKGTFPAPEHTF
jgi:ketopantoate hydroxymethyltransferase